MSLRGIATIAFLYLGTLAAQSAPPSDPEYANLRNAQLAESFVVENLVLQRDAGEIVLKSGTVSFTAPVLGKVTAGIFIGQGEFHFTPPVASEAQYMATLYGLSSVTEPFDRAAFFFTDGSYAEIKGTAVSKEVPGAANDALRQIRDRLRSSRDDGGRSLAEALVMDETMDNVDAEILTDLYNPAQPGLFLAYLHGAKYEDLRFQVRPRGALRSISTPEEVALINLHPGSEDDGIWYLAHLREEHAAGTARSDENKWLVDAQHYKIETEIDGRERITAKATVRFRAMRNGDRVLNFGLVPSLRVSAVSSAAGPVPFIQEARNQDGSLYVVLPEPTQADQEYELTFEYAGDRIIHNEGGGNLAVGARTSWYPSVNSFNDQATYDLTYKVPRQYTLASVGKPVKEERQGDAMMTQWVSEVPLAVAGFNYGQFKKKESEIKELSYCLEGYAARDIPDYLQEAARAMEINLVPSRLIDQALNETNVSMRIYSQWFGAAPYGRIAITQQPQFNFGQSWPGLVYLPLSAFLDQTQRYRLLGGISNSLNSFIQEVTPHEVAHQWWGHMVGWASYRDQWLSEGFADFSAGLFLQLTDPKQGRYQKFLSNARDHILDKNSFGFAANDVGPLHMGQRLNTSRSGGAYDDLVYSKGAYVLHMLRMMMWDPKTGDQAFQQMMQDFVQTYLYRTASTESFQEIVEKHANQNMRLTGDGKLDWFFQEWVYGTDVPKYDFKYEMTQENGRPHAKATLVQSGVTDNFRMRVPIYVEVDGRTVRFASVVMIGNYTAEFDLPLPPKAKKLLVNANYDILAYK